jgi:hypothetical protein
MNLADILKDSNYKLSQFTKTEIEQLEKTITPKPTKSGEVPYIDCRVRQKAIKLTPEEAIRQLYLQGFDRSLALSHQSHSGGVWGELWAGGETGRHCGNGQRPS